MSRRVAIVGIGLTECGNYTELSHKELLYRATRMALEDAGLGREDIGTAFTTSYDFVEGRSLSNQYTLDSIGGVMKPCDLRLGDTGLHGAVAGYMEAITRPYETVLVGSVLKSSERADEADHSLKLASLEHLFTRPVLANMNGYAENLLAAMEARLYMHRTGVTEQNIAAVAVKNYKNALKNNRVSKKREINREEILNSQTLAFPIKKLTVAEGTDIACVLILAAEGLACSICDNPVWIAGVGWCTDTARLTERDLAVSKATRIAASKAYAMASIKHPAQDIDAAEVYDPYAYKELQYCEALGLCPEGKAGVFIEEGKWEINGDLPVNPSGGLLGGGHAIGTSGLVRVAEAALQIRGEAGGHQLPRAEITLAHAAGDITEGSAGVIILSRW